MRGYWVITHEEIGVYLEEIFISCQDGGGQLEALRLGPLALALIRPQLSAALGFTT